MYRAPRLLAILASIATLALFSSVGIAHAQGTGESLTAVCVIAFEAPEHVRHLTDEEIERINGLEQDPFEPPVPEIVGYPDPQTGSCATENGVLKAYDPETSTPICVPSGPEGNGPLIVEFAWNQYLPGYVDVILADPVTGACPNQLDPAPDGDNPALVDALVDKLRDILRDALA